MTLIFGDSLSWELMDTPYDESTDPTSIAGGRYRILARLGRGGMGEIFEAFDNRLGRPVAIKFLRADLTMDSRLRRRLELEAEAAARLSHKNVITIFDVGEEDGRPFIVMELLSPTTLADRIRQGSLPVDAATSIARQLLSAVQVAHQHGILHRDIKPSNVLFDKDGEAKLSDFGIASIIEASTEGLDLTVTSEVLGTPSYLAPERARGERPAPESDLFSIGAVIYEMVTGLRPYRADTAIATVLAAQKGVFENATALNPDLSRSWDRFFSQALDPNPKNRFQSAAEMVTALDLAAKDTDITASRTIPMAGLLVPPLLYDSTEAMDPTARAEPAETGAEAARLRGWHSREVKIAAIAVALVLALVAWSAIGTGAASPKPATNSSATTTAPATTTTLSPTTTTTTTTTTTPLPPTQPGPPGKQPGGPPRKAKN